MCVCVCVCVHTCVVCVCVHTFVYVSVCVCVHTFVYVWGPHHLKTIHEILGNMQCTATNENEMIIIA